MPSRAGGIIRGNGVLSSLTVARSWLSGVIRSRRPGVIHIFAGCCRLSGCLDRIVVSVGQWSPPLTARVGRGRRRSSREVTGHERGGGAAVAVR